MFTIPTSTATSLYAAITSGITDAGFLYVLVAATAIPLLFRVGHYVKGLFTASGKKA